MASAPLRVAFLHPDLGIGGAERLVVDAALGLKNLGHTVHIFTSHHSDSHCFEETRDGSLPVTVVGDFLPRHLFGRFHVFFATLRMLLVALFVLIFRRGDRFDVFFVDQVSAPMPLIRILAPSSKILFYCHFPDKLLSTGEPAVALPSGTTTTPVPIKRRRGLARRIYRALFDWVEEMTMRTAHRVLFNSMFTASTTRSAFPSLANRIPTNDSHNILYPALNLTRYDTKPEDLPQIDLSGKRAVISINRFERKKNIALAVRAFSLVLSRVPKDDPTLNQLVLVIAGGYDDRLLENREQLQSLRSLAEELGVLQHTIFLPSFSDADRYALLHHDRSVIVYTPVGEHFGIVPIEAMYCGNNIVAANSAGPTESIINKVTGLLAEPDPEHFADAIRSLLLPENLEEEQKATEMRHKARQHVQDHFSLEAFSTKLEEVLLAMKSTARSRDRTHGNKRKKIS